MFVGIDFGTTNSAASLLGPHGEAEIVGIPVAGRASPADTLRSVVAFDRPRQEGQPRPVPLVGHDAIDAFLDGDGECRLLQSFKSYLTSRLFSKAAIHNRTYSLEELIALVVGRLRQVATDKSGQTIDRVVAGRPVRFVAEDGRIEDDFAVERLRQAFAQAGIHQVAFEYEPIAAAYYYESGLDHDETVLIADFGGGTSDFCLARLGPSRSRSAQPEEAIIGTGGVGLAGDAFDRRIVEKAVAEFFGKNSTYHSGGKDLPVPDWIYGKFARWHHLSFLGTPSTIRMLEDIQRHAERPELIDNLLTLIDLNLGYHLHRAVERVKLDLTRTEETQFTFDHAPIAISRRITRSDFEAWIAPDLAEIEECVDGLLRATGMATGKVDRVFMTGGTSLVPAVRQIFASRFGESRLSTGGEFVSVANGLAYRARELFA